MRIGHGDREAVGVGVVRDDEVGVGRRARLEREVHRARLFGVREGHGRERAVGIDLRSTTGSGAG